MNTLRRISRHLVTAVAASVVLIAAAVPLAIAESAGAAGTTVTCISISGVCSNTTKVIEFATGATGTLYVTGSGFADDQNTGGAVTITSTAPGLTFSSVAETSSTAATATYTSTSATVPGFYNLTFTDDNGATTLTNAIEVIAGPSVTTVTGNSGTSGVGTSAVVVTGSFAGNDTAAVTNVSGATVPTVAIGATDNTTTVDLTVNNDPAGHAATPGTYSIVITNPGTGGGSVSVPYTVNGSNNPALTAVTVSASGTNELIVPTTGSSAESVTLTGTGFENGATVSLSDGTTPSGTDTNHVTAPTSVTFVSATSITFSTTVSSGATAEQDTVTVHNPDGGASTNGTGALGVGEAGAALSSSSTPVAPSITESEPYGSLTPGGTSIITVTGSSTFPITTGATVKTTLTADATSSPISATGTVTAVSSSNAATVKITLPRFLTVATTAAYTSGSSLTVSDGWGIASALNAGSSVITVLDGTKTEKATVTSLSGTNDTTVNLSAPLTYTHASGVLIQYKTPTGPWTLSVNNGSSTQTTSITTALAPSSSVVDGNGAAVSGLTPGTYTLVLTDPGFGFVTGATVTFPGTATNGVTGTVKSVTANTATLSVTVPAGIPVAATMSAVNAGQKVFTLTSAGSTAPVAGATLSIDPNGTVSGPETVTIASVVGTSSPYTITLVNGFAAAHPSGAPVVGLTETNPGGGTIAATVTNGAGETDIISNLFTTVAAPTVTVTGGVIPAGTGNLDPADFDNDVAFAFSGIPTGDTTSTTNDYACVLDNPAPANCADWTVTTTTPGVSFVVADVTSSAVYALPTVKTGTAAVSNVPVTIADAQVTATTTTGTVSITAGPTVTSVTADGTLHAGVAASDSETIGVLGTGFNATTPSDNAVAFVTSSGAVDPNLVFYASAATATTLTVTVTAPAAALAGTDGVMVEVLNPAVSSVNPGETSVLANALTVVAPSISAASPASIPVLTATAPGNTATSTFTTSGFSSTGTFTCGVSLPLSGAAGGTLPTCTAAYVSGSTSSVLVTFTYNGASSTPGGILVTLTNSSQQAKVAMSILSTPVISALTVNTSVGLISNGSSSVPVTISGTGFLPGATVAATSSGATFTVASVTATAITGTLSLTYTATQPVAFTVTNTNGASGSFSATGIYGVTPTVTGTYLGLEGTTKSLVITGTGFVSGAVVSASVAGTVTFGTAVVNSATQITVPATYVGFTGTTPIVTSIVVTNPIGQGSATDSNALTINPGPTVTGTYYVPTFSTSVEFPITGTGFESGMKVTSSNTDYTVSLVSVNSAGTVATLLVTTDSNATSGTSSTITFTNPDGGSVQFALNGGPVPSGTVTAPYAIHKITGTAIVGKTSSILVTGTGFNGQPKVTSTAAGTKAIVSADSGTVLTIKVTTKAGTKPGTYTFTIKLPSGATKTVKYGVRAA